MVENIARTLWRMKFFKNTGLRVQSMTSPTKSRQWCQRTVIYFGLKEIAHDLSVFHQSILHYQLGKKRMSARLVPRELIFFSKNSSDDGSWRHAWAIEFRTNVYQAHHNRWWDVSIWVWHANQSKAQKTRQSLSKVSCSKLSSVSTSVFTGFSLRFLFQKPKLPLRGPLFELIGTTKANALK